MTVLFRRFVVATGADLDGLLRPVPGAAWRSERAVGEAGLDRRLAALATAGPDAICAFVSMYGFLREKTAALRSQPEPNARGMMQLAGLRGADDIRAAIEWVDAGCHMPAPPGAAMLMQVVELIPASAFDSLELLADGASDSAAEASLTFDPWAMLPDLMASAWPAAMAAPPPLPASAADRARLRHKLEAFEQMMRIYAGVEEAPAVWNELGGTVGATMTLFTSIPEAFAHPELGVEESRAGSELMGNLAAESVDDWRTAAAGLRSAVEAVDLILQTQQAGLSHDEKTRLRKLCLELTDGYTTPNLTAMELAERVAPMLRARLEAEMTRGGVLPVRVGSIAGVYWRALVVLWARLTDERPAKACAQEGCGAFLPPHASRLYCDPHRLARHRNLMRAQRAAGRATTP